MSFGRAPTDGKVVFADRDGTGASPRLVGCLDAARRNMDAPLGTRRMHKMSRHARMILLTVVTIGMGASVPAHAQPRLYAGGALTLLTRTHSATEQPLGGTTWGGSVLFGVQVSARLSVEFEPSFGGAFGQEYTYSPFPFQTVRVVTSRRDTFFTFQLRARAGVLEPVVGVSYVRGRTGRHANFVQGGGTYFDDQRSDNTLAVAGGIDAAVRIAPHFYFVPTFRALVVARPSPDDLTGNQTSGGRFVFRYGAGARATF